MTDEKNKKEEGSSVKNQMTKTQFPRNTLNEAIKVTQVIWQDNAGMPYQLIDVAKKLGHSPTSSSFRALIRSAYRYGLIKETFSQDNIKPISLTPLGKSIAAPTPDENLNGLKREALENPDLFKRVLSTLDGKILPPSDSFKNMLMRNFQLPKDDAESSYIILTKNIQELGLTEEIQGKTYVRLNKLGNVSTNKLSEEDGGYQDGHVSYPNTNIDVVKNENSLVETKSEAPQKLKVPKVFISHSKNKSVVTQIKEMLEFGEFEYEIAEERETLAIPIS